MRRTQLYLNDDLWNALHTQARKEGTTVSELVRQAARERYLGKLEQRREAMQAWVGIRKRRAEFSDAVQYVRGLRRGKRLGKIGE
jgi:hypothetical protein